MITAIFPNGVSVELDGDSFTKGDDCYFVSALRQVDEHELTARVPLSCIIAKSKGVHIVAAPETPRAGKK